MFGMRQQLGQNQEKTARAEKSLALIKNNLAKKKLQIKEDSQHVLQLDYDIETDKNKTLVSTLM